MLREKTAVFNPQKFNPLPDEKHLDWTKLKQIADDILRCIEMKDKCHIG